MRKGLIVGLMAVAILGAQHSIVLAKGIADNGPGCGLGKELWKDQNTDAWGKQVLISTTNNTIVPFQAFGITSQTMGCKNGGSSG